MNVAWNDRLPRVLTLGMTIVVLLGIVWLSVHHARHVRRQALAEATRNSIAEQAREDAALSSQFHDMIAEQTEDSLAQSRMQLRLARFTLVTAICLIIAAHVAWPARIRLPSTITSQWGNEPPAEDASEQPVAPTLDSPAVPLQPAIDLEPLNAIVSRVGTTAEKAIPLLHAIQAEYRYLPPPVLRQVCQITEITPAQVASVASFYTQFRTQPRGRRLVRVCQGTACHVAGADRITEELRRQLHIPAGADTDAEGRVTLEGVACLGCCTLAPVVQVEDHTHGHVGVEQLPALSESCRQPGGNGAAVSTSNPMISSSNGSRSTEPKSIEIRVGLGSCCVAGGSRELFDSLQSEIERRGCTAVLKPVGCVGMCHQTPLVEITPPGASSRLALRAHAEDARQLIRRLPSRFGPVRRLGQRLADRWKSASGAKTESPAICHQVAPSENRIRQFLEPQVRIVTEHGGRLNPLDLSEYERLDGFVALRKCMLELRPDEVINVIEQSGLRGRGGGGFPTFRKWQLAQAAAGDTKYVICNGDEGDPGAFMDRMVMESYPYRVLEGLAIAAYAIGAHEAILYIRHEYPLAVSRIRHAIEQMTAAGMLGDRLMGSEFPLRVRVVEGAGAFVCGEETALLQSIMGRRGTPQIRPPYPVEQGLWGQPTLVNNVETLASVPWIVRHGPEQFAALGTVGSKGTKVFSLSGKVQRGGLIEIPMGLTIRDVVEGIGGGVRPGKTFKAVQIGGPSGGCVPASLADTPIDYEQLQDLGVIMGSGGLVVMDNDDCMVDMARYFLQFTQHESCGHCTFCRIGTRRLLEILERFCEGKATARDLNEIESLAKSVKLGSLCGLGKTAPNPVLTTLRYFREEFEAHLNGVCPAGRCKNLIQYHVSDRCTGCTLCAQHCPAGAIRPTPYQQHWIVEDLCTRCDLCRAKCPEDAIYVK